MKSVLIVLLFILFSQGACENDDDSSVKTIPGDSGDTVLPEVSVTNLKTILFFKLV